MLTKRPQERVYLDPALLGHRFECLSTLRRILDVPSTLICEIGKYHVRSHINLPEKTTRRRAGRPGATAVSPECTLPLVSNGCIHRSHAVGSAFSRARY